MMHCTPHGEQNDETRAALHKLNECATTDMENVDSKVLQKYLTLFCEAICVGAIKELTINDTTYELYADVLETK